jgi:thiol-disulfide isomerase/thioredoxin
MPITHRHLLKIFLLLLVTSVCINAQEHAPRLKLSNDDPKWGEDITVSYTAPDSSPFASPKNMDTLYCAASFSTYMGERGVVVPMKYLQNGKYEATVHILDSTFSVWMEICIPTDRVPDGITNFTVRTADGHRPPGTLLEVTTNYDSAFAADIALYPMHYSSYPAAFDKMNELAGAGLIKTTDTMRHDFLVSLIQKLQEQPQHTPGWYLALSQLYARKRGGDSASKANLYKFAEAIAYDPIYNESNFWNYFFAPAMGSNGKLSFPVEKGRIIAPLINRFPKTEMAKKWLTRVAFDTLLDANIFRAVSNRWSNSHDVDILVSIGQAYNYKKSLLYDPVTALQWFDKAEESIRTNAGFYDGENIYGGMERISSVLADKAEALIVLGRVDEAVTITRGAIPTAKEQFQKTELRTVLAKAYLALGKLESAQREYGILLATSLRGTPDGLDELYKKSKQGDETEDAFKKRLADKYGNAEMLPEVPDFAYITMDGKKGSIKALRGKVVVMDFWFRTCAGCVIEKQSLNELVKKYKGDTNVIFLSVALDDESSMKNYLQHHESGFLIVPNGQAICDAVGVTGFPTHIILGRDGSTLRWDMGGGENSGDLMKPSIDAALAQK